MTNVYLHNLSRKQPEKITERKLRKLFRESTLVTNFYGKLLIYEGSHKGKRFYLIKDLVLDIVSYVEDDVGLTPSLPNDILVSLEFAIAKSLRKRLVVSRTDETLGYIVFPNIAESTREPLFDIGAEVEPGYLSFKLYNNVFIACVDIYYRNGRKIAIGIRWENLINLIYKAIVVFLSRKN